MPWKGVAEYAFQIIFKQIVFRGFVIIIAYMELSVSIKCGSAGVAGDNAVHKAAVGCRLPGQQRETLFFPELANMGCNRRSGFGGAVRRGNKHSEYGSQLLNAVKQIVAENGNGVLGGINVMYCLNSTSFR